MMTTNPALLVLISFVAVLVEAMRASAQPGSNLTTLEGSPVASEDRLVAWLEQSIALRDSFRRPDAAWMLDVYQRVIKKLSVSTRDRIGARLVADLRSALRLHHTPR